MEKGTTKSGFQFEIDESVFDDWDLLERLNAIDKGDTAIVVDVARDVLGTDQLERLKDHLRAESGKLTITAMTDALGEIFEACAAAKN